MTFSIVFLQKSIFIAYDGFIFGFNYLKFAALQHSNIYTVTMITNACDEGNHKKVTYNFLFAQIYKNVFLRFSVSSV